MNPASCDLSATRDLFLRLTTRQGKQKRSLDLLKNPEAPSPSDWFLCAPAFFNNALDLKLSDRKKDGESLEVWTQGADFSFSVGDTLYDTPEAYEPWDRAIKKIQICVQVVEAVAASGTESGARFEGRIKADILVPDSHRKKLFKKTTIETTQDEFVSFILFGPGERLSRELAG
ncbi:MAG: hypothetical protein ACKOAS_03625 [Verrucomicrobiota bacterium]